jgi:hypothetical protein
VTSLVRNGEKERDEEKERHEEIGSVVLFFARS